MAYGVDIEPENWTPIRNQVFTDILSTLEKRHSAALYLYLYDRAYHSPSKRIPATVAELARQTGIDARTANKCLAELLEQGLIRQVRQGVKRSKAKTRRPVWAVPLATIDLREGNWTPIPRNLICKYLPAYPNAVLLLVLGYHQHMKRLNFCWVGVTTLSKRLNWRATRIRDSLRYMFDKENWRSLHPELPWPLWCEIVKNKEGQPRRHFRVRAIEYEGKGKNAVMRLSKSFRMAFDLL
jgi:hypothetical protein